MSNTASEHLSDLEANFHAVVYFRFFSYAWIKNPFSVSVVSQCFMDLKKKNLLTSRVQQNPEIQNESNLH